jgi:hypothetical protein
MSSIWRQLLNSGRAYGRSNCPKEQSQAMACGRMAGPLAGPLLSVVFSAVAALLYSNGSCAANSQLSLMQQGCTVSIGNHACALLCLPPQVIVKKGEKDLPGLTDEEKPRMRGPKRASKVRLAASWLSGAACVSSHCTCVLAPLASQSQYSMPRHAMPAAASPLSLRRTSVYSL